MEIDRSVSDGYIDEMIQVLEFFEELKTMDDAITAVRNLRKVCLFIIFRCFGILFLPLY